MKTILILVSLFYLTSVVLANDNRFILSTHNYRIKRGKYEVYIKLDRYSGKTWKYSESLGGGWKIIPEGKDYSKLESGNEPRYKLLCHNFEKSRKEYEIYIRIDQKTGKTWKWSGTQSTWIVIVEEE